MIPDEVELIAFISKAVEKVPGVRRVHACYQGQCIPGFDTLCEQCANCPTFPSPGEVDGRCELGERDNTLCLPMRMLDRYFGFLNIEISDGEVFAPYDPYLRNLVSHTSVVMENRLAKRILQQKNEELKRAHSELESRVQQRTAELAALNHRLLQDIAERERMTAELEYWVHIFEHTEWGVVVGSVDGKTLELMNPAFARMHGYTVQELTGRSIADVYDPTAWPDVIEAINTAHEKGHHTFESRHIRKDGSIFPVLLDVTAVKNDQGEVLYRAVNVQDITERKLAEDKLRESEARFKGISSNIPGMVFQLRQDDSGLMFTYVSSGSRDVCGLAPECITADPAAFTHMARPGGRRAFHKSMMQSAESLSLWNWEGRLWDREANVKWVNLRATPRRIDERTVIWDGVIFNITESKQHEAEIRQSQKLLRALAAHQVTAKEEERKRIAREIHDELGQRLTALRLDVLMLPKQFIEGHGQLSELIKPMKDSIDGTMRIVRNIATELRPAALDMGIIMAVEWMLEEFQERMGILCKFNNKVGEEIALNDELATGFFRILQESLTNIARHAKATRVTVSLVKKQKWLTLTVKDNGKGITHKQINNDKSLGLIGIRERALSLGGKAEIKGIRGKGTTVIISIPIKKP